MRKLTSHLRALSLKAFWNWTAMSAQKPDRLRGGAAGVAELARLGAAGGAAEFVDVGTGEASVAASARSGQGLAVERVTLSKLVPEEGVEPTRHQVPLDFESSASASSATPGFEDCTSNLRTLGNRAGRDSKTKSLESFARL